MAPKKHEAKADKAVKELRANGIPSPIQTNDNAFVRFTSSETMDSIVYPDDTIEILAYVDALQAPRVVGSKGNYKLFKFVLNNDAGKRVQCLAWQDQIERVAAVVKMTKIIHLNGAVSKEILKPMYNAGNVPCELTIQQQTTIEAERGYFGLNSKAETKSTIVEWSELGDMGGRLIEISGWLKMGFKMTNRKSGDSAYGVGAITDGMTKLAIRIASFDDLPTGLRIGCAIIVVGVMHFEEIPYVQVTSGLNVKLHGKTPMDTELMHDITCIPKKKARMN